MVFTWCLTLNKFKHQWYCRRFSEGEINDLFYLQIPHYEWNSMELSTQDAWKEYLRKKIFKEGSSWWTYLLNNESHVTLSTELWVWFGEFWGWTTEQRFKKKNYVDIHEVLLIFSYWAKIVMDLHHSCWVRLYIMCFHIKICILKKLQGLSLFHISNINGSLSVLLNKKIDVLGNLSQLKIKGLPLYLFRRIHLLK